MYLIKIKINSFDIFSNSLALNGIYNLANILQIKNTKEIFLPKKINIIEE